MAELTIVFRLRFAVAVATAICLVAFVAARNATAEDAVPSEYIVQMDDGTSPARGMRLVERLGGRVTSPALSVINGFGASLSADGAKRLAANGDVHAVSPNGSAAPRADLDLELDDDDDEDILPPTDTNLTEEEEADLNGGADPESDEDQVGEARESGGFRCPVSDATTRAPRRYIYSRADRDPSVLSALKRTKLPFLRAARVDRAWTRATGKGVGVAVIDTGIAGDHPDFRLPGNRGTRVVASAVTNPCASDPDDNFGHGTHVAGLIAGNSLVRVSGKKELRGRYMGVAPRANLISVKVADDDGHTTVLDVIYGIQFAVEHREQFGIRVVNLSLSSTVADSYLTDPLDAAVESAWFSGLVVVAAAGNEGEAPDAVSYAPGNDPYVITAGSLDDRGTWPIGDDLLASWSSRGLTQDGFRKPDVLASGTRLVAPLAPGSDFVDLCRTCVVDREYFRVSGTSMSAAVVSGVAALMLERNPGWTPDQVKGALLSTMRQVPGAGAAVDADAALTGSGTANAGLTPNTLIDPSNGLIDWSRASFRRASFRDAAGSPQEASWSRASFRCDCSLTPSGEVEPSRASFRRVSFRRTSDFDR
jgi:serine protease AprX